MSVFRLAITGIAHKSEQPIEYSALFMWIKGMNGWLPLILPLLMSFGYIAVLSAERHNGMTGFLLIRSQNAKYCATKVTAGVLTGGILFMTANIVFGLMMFIAFPAYISFSVDEQMMYADWYGTGSMVLIYVVKRLIGSFLYGMAASMFGIGAAIFLGIGICFCAFRFYLITYTRRFCRDLHLKTRQWRGLTYQT